MYCCDRKLSKCALYYKQVNLTYLGFFCQSCHTKYEEDMSELINFKGSEIELINYKPSLKPAKDCVHVLFYEL
ncbi:MAG: hypothetical protein HRU09_16650 [Oligoflexales bacterium]|nr:hypothetical protein [Oligoflexales bacterium]